MALVTEYYYPHIGGVSEHVHHFAAELRRRGHAVDIITGRIGHAAPTTGVIRLGTSVPVYSNGSHSRITVGRSLRRAMRETLREGAYDIVHVHAPFTPVLPLLAITEADCPVVGTVHTWFPRSALYSIFSRQLQQVARQLSVLIAVSPTAIHAYERYMDADWHVVPNGIDLHAFRPDLPAPEGLGDDPYVLFVGRFDPRNALDTMLQAFERVQRRVPRAKLVVVGDGPLRAYYRHLARGHRNVILTGTLLDERPNYYANAAVYACPTTRASFGMTLLESMACATPIVCSDIVGFRDVVTAGQQALMVPTRSATSLAASIERLLQDDGLSQRMGRLGWQTAQQYGWPAVTDRVLALYDVARGVRRVAA
ncbi:MAG: glycosyltransferase family 4 protein [Gemmatimonadaceae bacterium]